MVVMVAQLSLFAFGFYLLCQHTKKKHSRVICLVVIEDSLLCANAPPAATGPADPAKQPLLLHHAITLFLVDYRLCQQCIECIFGQFVQCNERKATIPTALCIASELHKLRLVAKKTSPHFPKACTWQRAVLWLLVFWVHSLAPVFNVQYSGSSAALERRCSNVEGNGAELCTLYSAKFSVGYTHSSY